jgi:GNAT superfamily N-acetyltransferase
MIGTVEGALDSSNQLLVTWKAVVEDLGAKARTENGVAILWAECSFLFFNSLSFNDANVTEEDLENRLLFSRDLMKNGKHSGVFWLFEELLTTEARSKLDMIYEKTGFKYMLNCYGMSGFISSISEPFHQDLRFERVRTQEHLNDFATINARGYGIPEPDVFSVFQNSKLWLERIYAFVGYYGDKPVCCAGTYPNNGCLFVILVATEPRFQKRGYGESVTRKAIYEGYQATGFNRATLHATQAGRPVYERIGLRANSVIQILGLK